MKNTRLILGLALAASLGSISAGVASPAGKRSIVWTRTDGGMVRVIYDERDQIVSQKSYGEVAFQRYHTIRRGSPHRKEVALTFDTGNLSQTAYILDVLKKKKIKATFFLSNYPHLPGTYIGTLDEERVGPLVRRMVAEGHEIGNHTWHHHDLVAGKDPAGKVVSVNRGLVEEELQRVERHVRKLCGADMAPMWRAPFGSTNPRINRWAAEAGYAYSIGWTEGMDSLDWMVRYSATETLARLKEGTIPGGIYLFHMGCDNRMDDPVAKILPELIDWLHGDGYRCVAVSELVDQLWLLKEQKMIASRGSAVSASPPVDDVASNQLYRVDEGGEKEKEKMQKPGTASVLARLRSKLREAGTVELSGPVGEGETEEGREEGKEEEEAQSGTSSPLPAPADTRLVRLFRARKAAREAETRVRSEVEAPSVVEAPVVARAEGPVEMEEGEGQELQNEDGKDELLKRVLDQAFCLRATQPRRLELHVAATAEPVGESLESPAKPDDAAPMPAAPVADEAIGVTPDPPAPTVAEARAVEEKALPSPRELERNTDRLRNWIAKSGLGLVTGKEHERYARELEIFRPRVTAPPEALRPRGVGMIWVGDLTGDLLSEVVVDFLWEDLPGETPLHLPVILGYGGVTFEISYRMGEEPVDLRIAEPVKDPDCGKLRLPLWLPRSGGACLALVGWRPEIGAFGRDVTVPCPMALKDLSPEEEPGAAENSLRLVSEPDTAPLPLPAGVDPELAPMAHHSELVTPATVLAPSREESPLDAPKRREWLRQLSGFCRWQDYVDRRSESRLAAPPQEAAVEAERQAPTTSAELGQFRDRDSVRALRRYLDRMRQDVFPDDHGRSE